MKVDYALYLATDRDLLAGGDLAGAVTQAVAGGVTLVQLREKRCDSGDFYRVGCAVHAVTLAAGVPLIINDRVDIMLALNAEGVHVGTRDIPLAVVRSLASDRIVGYSVSCLSELEHAEREGADYVGVGPVFPTGTKKDAGSALGLEGLRRIVDRSTLPCVAIGGISPDNAADVYACGVAGVCAISAILGAPDIGEAAKRFRKAGRPRL